MDMASMDVLRWLLRVLVSGGLGGYIAMQFLSARVANKRAIGGTTSQQQQQQQKKKNEEEQQAHLDCRRKAQIATACAVDHAGEVVVVDARKFDMDKTIFGSLEGAIPRLVIKSQIAVELFWSDPAVQRIEDQFATVPRPPDHNKAILDFMKCDCNFAMEHADGSFLDHLQFCYEYSVHNFKGHSPRVLFLHSIMGVGTNFFPMGLDKEPKLKSLLDDTEFAHIEAFPSFVRLLNAHALVEELRSNMHRLDKFQKITFHRVIDNAEISLDEGAFWDHMNYQMVHLMDFLPASNWGVTASAPLFQTFLALYNFLVDSGKLEAKVDIDLKSAEPTGRGLPLTLGGLISSVIPSGVKKNISIKAVTKFSKKINHSLDYKLAFSA